MTAGLVLGLVGSLRVPSHTGVAVDRVLAAMQGVPAKRLDQQCLVLPLCDGRPEARLPAAVVRLRAEVAAAQALVIGSPQYNNCFSAVIKNALEWIGPGLMRGRIVGIVTVAEGASAMGAATALQSLCVGMGAWVVPVMATVPLAEHVFAEPSAPFAAEVLRSLDTLGAAIPEACRRLDPGRLP